MFFFLHFSNIVCWWKGIIFFSLVLSFYWLDFLVCAAMQLRHSHRHERMV